MRRSSSVSEAAKRRPRAAEPIEAELFDADLPPAMTRLLVHALEAFAELGFHGTTTRDIARRAEVSAAGLYTHYSSKDELLERIIRVTHETMLSEMREVFAQPADPVERLRNLVHAHARFHATYHTAARLANYELHSLSKERRAEMVRLRQEMERIMGEALRLGMVSGDFDITDEHLMTMSILSLGIDVSRWFRPGKQLSPDELGAHYAELVLRMVERRDRRPVRAEASRRVAAVTAASGALTAAAVASPVAKAARRGKRGA